MSNPTVSLANSLDFSVTVYDSFSNQDNNNYFGTLTSLTTVQANTTASVQLLHPTSVLIVSNATTNAPLARLVYSSALSTGPLGVAQADVDAMAQTMQFISFISNNQNDPLTVAFQALWKDSSTPQVTPVNQFFAKHPPYTSCTFATYMMGVTYTAEQPESKGKPLDQAAYSLSSLATLLGGTWPPGFPDIVVTNFTCNTQNGVLAIQAGIDLKELPAQSDEELQFFGSLFAVQQLQVVVDFNYALTMSVFGTRLSISLDAMHVPFGGSSTLTINQPTVTIDINPLVMFVVFTVKGSIPFNVFGSSFEADVSVVLDNIEASFGVVIEGDNVSLSPPPLMKGVHFDSFGVGIGIVFEPPGAAIGLSGQLHIGDAGSGTQVSLDDDTFAVVCELVEEIPNPLYVSFYVPQMQLTDVITVFTNAQSPLDLPVSFRDLCFQWAENPLEPVALPDGSLSNMGYGFSAAVDILSFTFYGDISINLTNGLTADIEMAPLALGSIFSITGDGPGVSIKVDASGNPIKNNQLATTAAQQQALKDATTQQLVAPGGPVLNLSTSTSPYLHVDATVSLFEVENFQVDANITSSGIEFEVGFSGVVTSLMSCTLTDWDNLSATFQCGIDDTISLPTIAGVSLGSISLDVSAGVHFALSTSTSDLVITVGGNFDFEGLNITFGDFVVDIPIQTVSDLVSAIVTNIEQNAEQLFSGLLSTAEAWAGKVKQGIITAVDSVASVLQNAFNQSVNEVASTMKDAGFGLEEVAGDLKDIFDPGDIAGALSSVFGLSGMGVAQTMQQVGFAGIATAGALQVVFGNDAGLIASALQGPYGWSPEQVQGAMGQIGFPPALIGQAFSSMGGAFGLLAGTILGTGSPAGGPPAWERALGGILFLG